MSTYTSSTENTLQAGLQKAKLNNYRTLIEEMILPKFKIGDCFVTLTFKEGYKYNEVSYSEKLKKFSQKLNRAIYGKSYDKGRIFLNIVPIAEFSNSQGLHIHILLQRPEPNDRYKGSFEALIKRIWLSMNWGTQSCAQDIRDIYDVEGAVKYITKQIYSSNDALRFDINNCKW